MNILALSKFVSFMFNRQLLWPYCIILFLTLLWMKTVKISRTRFVKYYGDSSMPKKPEVTETIQLLGKNQSPK